MTDEKPEEAPTGPEPGPEPGVAGSGTASNEAPDVDTPAWEGPAEAKKDEGPRLIDPRPEIPGPAGF